MRYKHIVWNKKREFLGVIYLPEQVHKSASPIYHVAVREPLHTATPYDVAFDATVHSRTVTFVSSSIVGTLFVEDADEQYLHELTKESPRRFFPAEEIYSVNPEYFVEGEVMEDGSRLRLAIRFTAGKDRLFREIRLPPSIEGLSDLHDEALLQHRKLVDYALRHI